MGLVLCNNDCSDVDIRIKPCLIDFVKTKMLKYAKEHKWNFSLRDFDFVYSDPEMIRLYEREISKYNMKMLEQDLQYGELVQFIQFNQVEIPLHLQVGYFLLFYFFNFFFRYCLSLVSAYT